MRQNLPSRRTCARCSHSTIEIVNDHGKGKDDMFVNAYDVEAMRLKIKKD